MRIRHLPARGAVLGGLPMRSQASTHRNWRTGAARRWVALAATLFGVVTFLAFTPATAAANPHAAAASRSAGSGVIALDSRPQASTGVVPNVVDWPRTLAITAIQSAGFVAQTSPGSFDCGSPYVQQQWPVGGTSAPLGSTVHIVINRQPRPQDCP
jgi:hypothetical protein